MKAIPQYSGYFATEDGAILSTRLDVIPYVVKGAVNSCGYRTMQLRGDDGKRKNWRAHQLVLLAFVGPRPDGMEARHLDGNRLNNAIANLSYGTKVENMADKKIHGTAKPGEKNWKARFTDEQVLEIRKKYAAGARNCDLAREYGTPFQTMHHIVSGKRWRHLLDESEMQKP